MLSPARRRALGAFYTPGDVADRLVGLALPDGAPRVCDPACGDGAFLLAAARRLESRGLRRDTIVRDLLWGIDIDADAVDATRTALTEWAGVGPGDHVIAGDALEHVDWAGRFDTVVGNPPFLNQLETATARTATHRWRHVVGPYADTAFLFLMAGLDLVHDGGRIVLIQPQSLVAARDAAAVRDDVRRRAALAGMWTCDEPLFDASVRVCAPILEKGRAAATCRVRRWTGRAFAEAMPATVDGPTWGAALTHDVPSVALDSARRLGDLASATAGFREQFYGLAPYVVDEPDGDLPKLVTCGVIDANRCHWGARPLRFAGSRWTHPRVRVDRIERPTLRRWVQERLVPKVVVATQTKVVEAAVDTDGSWVPSTPVIAVHTSPELLWAVAAVLAAPPVSAWAAGRYAGVALASGAIKLSARQVLEVPVPPRTTEWHDAAAQLEAGDLVGAARRMNDAYGAEPAVFAWWSARAPHQ
jgi:predicted RNA methylase